MRSPGELPPAPVWLKVSVASIQSLWLWALSLRNWFMASGCLAVLAMVPAESPWLRSMPSRAASAPGLARARFTSSRKYCSWALGWAMGCCPLGTALISL